MIIERPEEVKRINDIHKWILVYGRRKTGKTFLIRNFIKYDEYFFVKKDRNLLTKDNKPIDYSAFIEILTRALKENKTVVVDEFHRLQEDFFDFLHFTEKNGKLILISSTLFLSKNLISSKSPLLGLFAEINLRTIKLKDCLKALKSLELPKKEQLELAILASEPLAIDYINEKRKPREIIAEVVLSTIKTMPALIGEIFVEEEREMSAVYEGILRAIASGKIISSEISSYLFSRKLINKDDPSIIQQYLKNLIDFGLIKKLSLYDKARFAYKISSPLMRIYFYTDEKYNISERVLSEKDLAPIIDDILPRIVEDKIREAIAEKYSLVETLFDSGDFEVDGILLKFKEPEIVLEVKWKKLAKEEIRQIEEKLRKIEGHRRILFVPGKKEVISDLEVWDIDDLLREG